MVSDGFLRVGKISGSFFFPAAIVFIVLFLNAFPVVAQDSEGGKSDGGGYSDGGTSSDGGKSDGGGYTDGGGGYDSGKGDGGGYVDGGKTDGGGYDAGDKSYGEGVGEKTDTGIDGAKSESDKSFWSDVFNAEDSKKEDSKNFGEWIGEKVEALGQFINITYYAPLLDVHLPIPDEEKPQIQTTIVQPEERPSLLYTPALWLEQLIPVNTPLSLPPPEENVPSGFTINQPLLDNLFDIYNYWGWFAEPPLETPQATINFENNQVPSVNSITNVAPTSGVQQPTTNWQESSHSLQEPTTDWGRPNPNISLPTTEWGSEGSAVTYPPAITNILDPLEKEVEPDDCELALIEEGPEELPEAPLNLVGSCSGTTVTVSWGAAPSAKCYAVQVDNLGSLWRTGESGYPNCTNNNPASPSGDVCTDLYPKRSLSFTGQAGATYGWWVNGWNGRGLGPVATGNTFSCPSATSTTPTP